MADNTKWTEEQERELKERWAARDSCAVIGRALGFTRCAVAGKIRRLGITRSVQKPLARKSRVVIPRIALEPPPPPAPYIEGTGVTTLALVSGQCRFVLNDSAPWRHCGRDGRPWCGHHRGIVYRRAGAVEA